MRGWPSTVIRIWSMGSGRTGSSRTRLFTGYGRTLVGRCCDGRCCRGFAAAGGSAVTGWRGSAGLRQPSLVLLGQQPREQVRVVLADRGDGTVTRFGRGHALGAELCVASLVGGRAQF